MQLLAYAHKQIQTRTNTHKYTHTHTHVQDWMLNEKCMEAQTQEVGKLHVVLSQTSVSLVSSKEEAAKSSTPFDGVQNVKAKISVQADDDEGAVHFCEVVSLLASKRTRLRQGGRVAKRAFFPLDPDSPHKHAWDIFVVMLLISALFLGPYNLAFAEDSQPGEAMTTMEILDVFIDCTFCIDIAFTFLTAYLKDGVYVNSLQLIAERYLKGWFWVDMPSSVPWDKLIRYIAAASDAGLVELGPLMRVVRFTRILKVVRFAKLVFKFDQMLLKDENGKLAITLKMFRAFFAMFFVAHLTGCMFYLFSDSNEVRDGGPYTARTFLSQYYDGDDDMLHAHDPVPVDNIYVVCLYWGLSTVATIGCVRVRERFRVRVCTTPTPS